MPVEQSGSDTGSQAEGPKNPNYCGSPKNTVTVTHRVIVDLRLNSLNWKIWPSKMDNIVNLQVDHPDSILS